MNARVDNIDVQLVEAPGFSYALFDRLDPARTKGNSSTTIAVVNTNAASSVLGSDNTQERNDSEHDLRIGEAGATYWQSRVKVDRWTRDTIECSAVGGNAAWMELARTKKLRSCKMGTSENIDGAYQQSTWTDESLPIHFPLIDYGYLEGRAASFNVLPQFLRPACRLWRFMEVGFSEIGFAIKAKGRFAKLAPKLIMPNVADNIEGDQQTKDGYTAVVTGQDQSFQTTTNIAQDTFTPDFDTIVSDPANTFNLGTDRYTVPVRMNLQPLISMDIQVTTPGTTFPQLFIFVRTVGGGITQSQLLPTSFNGTTAFYSLTDYAAPVMDLGAGVPAWITLEAYGTGGSAGSQVSVLRPRVRWQPVFIPYQAGITIDINTIAPDWTLADCVKNLSALLNVKFVTNDRTGQIEVWHYDDFLKGIPEGVDMRGRENFVSPSLKLAPQYPVRYRWRFEEDDKDRDLREVNSALSGPGLGNKDSELGGYLPEITVDVDWSATAMGTGLSGNVFIPIMREANGVFQRDQYKRKERILIADGVTDAAWRLDTTNLTVQPKVYFVWPGEQRYSLSFADEFWYGTTAAGTVSQYHAEYLRRATTSYMLGISLRLWDDELQSLDLTRPVLVWDGYQDAWWYILKVDQKRFGVDEYTRCELMQV